MSTLMNLAHSYADELNSESNMSVNRNNRYAESRICYFSEQFDKKARAGEAFGLELQLQGK